MRIAVGWFLSAVVLIVGYAAGIVGAWALVVVLVAAVGAAITMEDRGDPGVEGLIAAAAPLREPGFHVLHEAQTLDDFA